MAFTGCLIKKKEAGKGINNFSANIFFKPCSDRIFLFYFYVMQQCLFCGQPVTLIHIHGHYQCPVCNANALPCCDGDNCDTNQLLTLQLSSAPSSPKIKDSENEN
jgi:hypothetical protein